MSDMSNFGAPEEGHKDFSAAPPSPGRDDSAHSRANADAPREEDSQSERRSRRRALISAPVRVRGLDVTTGPDEVSTTLDVSRSGFLFVSSESGFNLGMEVAVTFPYSKSPTVAQAEQRGRVARITKTPDGRLAIGIALGPAPAGTLEDATGRKIEKTATVAPAAALESGKPVVLVVDADPSVRSCLKSYLDGEGYEVVAVATAAEAHRVLIATTPALLIAEIEGEDLPGYELCAHVKGTPRLCTVPVVLLTQSAYPSDYANAHSLGAVVCMAKPFRPERIGHVARLLAPTPEAKQQTGPAHAADPKRKGVGRGNNHKSGPAPKNHRRSRK